MRRALASLTSLTAGLALALACGCAELDEGADDHGHDHDHDHETSGDAGDYPFELPEGFPAPLVPEDNPPTEAKFELGRLLFYDTQLSANGTQSCGSCHFQELAFTDGAVTPLGSTTWSSVATRSG